MLRPHREVRLLKWRDFNKELTYVSVDGSRVKSKRNRIMPIPEFIRKELIVGDSDDNVFSGPPFIQSCSTATNKFIFIRF